ncbi:histone-lysine N-methyltransferase ASHR1 isoform X3 [Cucumis melo var. makuwa]|uniref:Histone-lysine N-methyltransferase ASHR1 isoform X3 n=1 Tax=Cucumis melo var. makuwa TaxID=1194695 RepID=A0A5D3BUH3_CUCMM|nr:histone-lysine N-methyltransferase ASHR1 isoform X3 [Cucumis melo var. makuwa]
MEDHTKDSVLSFWYQSNDFGGIMVQTQIEERLELIDQEIAGMKKDISKMLLIELSLNDIVKNLEVMRLQSKKQQQMLLLMMESMAKDRSTINDRTTESAARDSAVAKGKESEATSSKTTYSDRNIGECRNEKKSDIEDTSADRSKFKKGRNPDSWLFHAERNEANLNGFTGGKYPTQSTVPNKSLAGNTLAENKGNTTFPIRTITLRSLNANKIRKEVNSRRLPDTEFQA